jgi:hypothetical protein
VSGHNVVVLSTQEYRPNKYFDSFDEAMEYGNKVQQLKRLYGGYNVYKWRHNKYVRVLRWEELN